MTTLVRIPFSLLCLLSIAFCFTLTTTFANEKCSRKEKYCVGETLLKDGIKYKGEFKYGVPHGWGEMTWPSGDFYEGQFDDGLRHGKGEMNYANGDYYEGQFRFGFLEGKGVYLWSNGARYSGGFQRDLMEGVGVYRNSNGESYEGEWLKGLAHGRGSYIHTDGGTFIGNYKEGKRHGAGVIKWRNGAILKAKWKKGLLNGEGYISFENSDQLEAKWVNGDFAGLITYHNPNQRLQAASLQSLQENVQVNGEWWEVAEENFAFIWYVMGLESKTNKQYIAALKTWEKAAKMLPSVHNLQELIHHQKEQVKRRMEASKLY